MRSFCLGFISALLMVAAVGVFAGAKAEEMWAVVSGIAIHLDGRDHCNSTTSGLGIEKNGYAVGFYRNSNCKWSTYAAKAWLPLRAAGLKLGAIGGAVTGYKTSVLPAAGFAAAFEKRDWGFNVILIPPISDSSTGVVWLQTKFRW